MEHVVRQLLSGPVCASQREAALVRFRFSNGAAKLNPPFEFQIEARPPTPSLPWSQLANTRVMPSGCYEPQAITMRIADRRTRPRRRFTKHGRVSNKIEVLI